MEKLTYSISLARKINTGNYTSADAFECLSGVTNDTTEQEMLELLDGKGALAFRLLKERLIEKVKDMQQTEWDALVKARQSA